MRRWIWPVALSAGVMTGCPSESSFECGSDNDCGADGRCEPTGFCSFPDSTCASGYRYGDLAESLSNQCVIEEGTTTSSVPTTTADGSTTTSTDGTSSGPMMSSDDSGSTFGSTSTQGESSSTTDTDATGPGSTDTGSTTGGPECLVDEFDVLPALPEWFVYSNSQTLPTAEDGQLLLPIDLEDGEFAFAGLRTDNPRDFSGTASAEVVITNLPGLSQATTALAINDETFNNQNSLAITIISGMLRVEQFEGGAVEVLATQPFEPGNVPLTLEISVVDAQVTFNATGPEIDEMLFQLNAPGWFSDAYVSIDVGNPTTEEPAGVPRFDRIEVCGGPL